MNTQIFDNIFTKNNSETIELVAAELQSKAYNLIQQRKSEVAKNIFNQDVSEE